MNLLACGCSTIDTVPIFVLVKEKVVKNRERERERELDEDGGKDEREIIGYGAVEDRFVFLSLESAASVSINTSTLTLQRTYQGEGCESSS